MRFDPVRYTLVVNTQLATDPPQIHPIHIQLHCFFTKLRIIIVRLLLRRIFAATQVTPIALAPRWVLAYFVLLFFTATSWTFHPPILPTLSPLPALKRQACFRSSGNKPTCPPSLRGQCLCRGCDVYDESAMSAMKLRCLCCATMYLYEALTSVLREYRALAMMSILSLKLLI